MTTENSTPKDIIDIPQIENYDLFERNREKADDLGEQHCPCCGKVLLNPKFFINSIWGGQAYPASDKNEYSDAWVMGVGSECRKKFPEGYIFTNNI
jgi:hypothetical protein